MGCVYLIRYGLARVLGRFESPSGGFERGQSVVVRTHRGTEIGEVVGEAPPALASPSTLPPAPILRIAGPEDLDRAIAVRSRRAEHFAACRSVFEGGTWPLELIDAEPLLDEGRTVLHYLGPHRLDASGLVAAFRDRCGLEVVLEPVGRDAPEPEPEAEAEEEAHGCGSCGSSGGGGGCGSGGCGSEGGGCAVKSLVASRRKVAAQP